MKKDDPYINLLFYFTFLQHPSFALYIYLRIL